MNWNKHITMSRGEYITAFLSEPSDKEHIKVKKDI